MRGLVPGLDRSVSTFGWYKNGFIVLPRAVFRKTLAVVCDRCTAVGIARDIVRVFM
jgi:hypothetical protein